jgi:hypothetical protein
MRQPSVRFYLGLGQTLYSRNRKDSKRGKGLASSQLPSSWRSGTEFDKKESRSPTQRQTPLPPRTKGMAHAGVLCASYMRIRTHAVRSVLSNCVPHGTGAVALIFSIDRYRSTGSSQATPHSMWAATRWFTCFVVMVLWCALL